jgi:hypothetical protein
MPLKDRAQGFEGSRIRGKEIDPEELRRIEHMAETRFNCNFWGSVSVKRAIKQLLMHIKYQDERLKGKG